MSASAVGDVSHPPIHDDRVRDALETIIAGRKSWKALKGKDEAVWPPSLEAALIEGLDTYRPESSNHFRLRLPNRNVFISDYIFRVTGKRRTPKQVGSRIQQLRDTEEGRRILKLFTDRDTLTFEDKPSPSIPSVPASSTHGPSPSPNTTNADCAFVYIDVLPAEAPCPGPANITSPSGVPRPLHAIDPTVTFTFSLNICAQSTCMVYYKGNCVHREVTPLTCTPALSHDGVGIIGYVYHVALIPGFWNELCKSNNPGSYAIVQEIGQLSHTSPQPPALSSVPSVTPTSATLLRTVVYQFNQVAFFPPSAASYSPSISYAASGPSSLICSSPSTSICASHEYSSSLFMAPSYTQTSPLDVRDGPFAFPFGEDAHTSSPSGDVHTASRGAYPSTIVANGYEHEQVPHV